MSILKSFSAGKKRRRNSGCHLSRRYLVCARPLRKSEIFWMAEKLNLLVFKTLGKRPLGRARKYLEVSIAKGLKKLDREYWT